MLMAVEVHSVANTPPLIALKPSPYDWELLSEMPQPAFADCPDAFTSQLEVDMLPEKAPELMVQPGPV